MRSILWEMSSRLVSEQRYLALKDSQKFQQKMGSSTIQGARYIRRMILGTYFFTSAMMVAFSFFLVFADYGVTAPVAHLQSISFIIYSYIFLFSLYSVIMFINIVKNYRLFEPMKPLPTNLGHSILPVAWFAYNGSSSLFIIFPLLYEYSVVSGNYYAIPLGLLWGLAVMAMGYMVGILAVSFASSRGSSRRKGKMGAISSIVRLLGIIAIFILFEIATQEPSTLPALPQIASFPYIILVPLINVPYISFPVLQSSHMLLAGIGVTALYAGLILILFWRFNRRIFLRITEQKLSTGAVSPATGSRDPVAGFYRNNFFKDVRNIFRKPQNATMILIPIFTVTPTLFQVFYYSATISFGSISIYYSLLSIVIFASSFYSIALIISEGNGISVLQSLPVKQRDIVYSKNLVGTFLFAIIVTPISVLFLLKESPNILTFLLLPANLIVAYVYTSLFNLGRLMKKLPRGSTTVNFYSFGGNLALATLFGITLVFTAVPTVIATGISYLAILSPFSHPVSFYLSSLALNLGALFIIMNMLNRSVS